MEQVSTFLPHVRREKQLTLIHIKPPKKVITYWFIYDYPFFLREVSSHWLYFNPCSCLSTLGDVAFSCSSRLQICCGASTSVFVSLDSHGANRLCLSYVEWFVSMNGLSDLRYFLRWRWFDIYIVLADDFALSGGAVNWSSNSDDTTPHRWASNETNSQVKEKVMGQRGLLPLLLSLIGSDNY